LYIYIYILTINILNMFYILIYKIIFQNIKYILYILYFIYSLKNVLAKNIHIVNTKILSIRIKISFKNKFIK